MITKLKVRWFDKLRGEGSVESLDGEFFGIIYACNIPGKKTWFPETACVYYERGQVVDADITDYRAIRLFTKGIFDADKWNSLDQDRLAFRCDDDGKAINGLFG